MTQGTSIGKAIVVGLLLFFVTIGVSPCVAEHQKALMTLRFEGNWLYVGGSGPDNYSKIQYAIDNASDRDTVFVYDDSSPYVENVTIGKSLTLRGEQKNSTLIEGAVHITTSEVTFCHFTLQNEDSVGVNVFSPTKEITDVVISDNIINNISWNAIQARNASVTIERNILKNNGRGVALSFSNAIIEYNIIHHNWQGISGWVNGLMITYNDIRYSTVGIGIGSLSPSFILKNTLQDNKYGIFLDFCIFQVVKQNNFINNSVVNAQFFNVFFTRWVQNYWDDWIGFGPYLIFGTYGLFNVPRFYFDWHPAQEPHDITG